MMCILSKQQQIVMITKLLRRFGFINQDKTVKANKQTLLRRREKELSLLQPLIRNTDEKLLSYTIEELLKVNNQTVFNTFTTRCLKPDFQHLNGLADVNIQRVFEKQAHNKIPFTVKDHLKVQGLIHTCGFTDNLKPSQTTSDVVHFLQQEGCIAFAKTNVPQGLLGIESDNTLYGRAMNPQNPKFISGGSSGGEGTCVASKVCSFGVGSDSGGSARIPAAFCGTYSFKPTGSKRLSLKGRVNPRGSQGIKMGDVDPCMGFITRHFDDLRWLASKTLGKSTTSYPFMYGGLWDQSRYQAAKRNKLTVGYIYKNHQMKVAPGLINTIDQTLHLLRKDGHTIVEFDFPELDRFRDFFFEFVHQTGFLNGLVERMKGHCTAHQIADMYDIVSFGRWLGAQKKKNMANDPLIKRMYGLFMRNRTTEEFFRIHREVDEMKKKFMKEWEKNKLDVLVSPAMPFTALLPGVSDILVYQLTYSCFQNVIQLPAGIIPTRPVKSDETSYVPTNQFEKKAAPSIHSSQGLPLSIQITGKHLGDEELLGAMYTINNLVGGRYQEVILK